MFDKFRKSRTCKVISLVVTVNFLMEVFFPLRLFALTTGPTHPEIQSFEPVDTSEMVDLFSGDFCYNIPLLDVDGYPINLFYHSGSTIEDEASWVGLGWNINVGSINRVIRGIPDDFCGDTIETILSMKPNKSYGVTVGLNTEIYGSEIGLQRSIGLTYNNYVGLGIEQSFGTTFALTEKNGTQLTASLGISNSTMGGASLRPGLSLATRNKPGKFNGSLSAGLTVNSREGLAYYNFGMEARNDEQKKYSRSRVISLNPNTYLPEVNFPYRTTAITLEGELGATCYGFDQAIQGSAYYNQQVLAANTVYNKAYGYLYSEKGFSRSDALMDYNREKDGVFTRNTPALPVTNYTYDIYTVTGQNSSGVYRPYRSDYGYIFDPEVNSTSDSYSIGLELDLGCIAKPGVDIITTDVSSSTGKWYNPYTGQLMFTAGTKHSSTDFLYEPYYFKKQGDISPDPMTERPGPTTMSQFDSLGGFTAVKANLDDAIKFDVTPDGTLQGTNFSAGYLKKQRHQRQKRNETIQTLTKEEIENYENFSFIKSKIYEFDSCESHHILALIVTNEDGSRSIYGLPGIQKDQVEVTFNVSGNSVDHSTGLVSYDPNKDNTTGNDRGNDHYFRKRKVDDHVTNYYLTQVLSPDYVDVTGDGPSDDDLGTYVNFYYDRMQYTQWRTPCEENKANYNEGLKTKTGRQKGDDRASYFYGKLGCYILKSIETKKYKAIFYLNNDRNDIRSVKGENGGINNDIYTCPFSLDSISVYSKHDLNPSNPSPIKEVHFMYDYILCPGVPNYYPYNPPQDPAKLTLTGLYFTHGKSNRGRFSPYRFEYGYNPAYNPTAKDRWGYYNPPTGGPGLLSPLSQVEFPYVKQDKEAVDEYMSAWNLSKIHLPSGGRIEIDYEADDYAYVQDKEAAVMMIPRSIGSIPEENLTSATLTEDSKLYFNLPECMSDWTQEQVSDFLTRSPQLYFRSMAQVNKSTSNLGYEYVSGYAEIKDCGIEVDQGINYLFIQLVPIKIGNLKTEINPISAAAIMFGRTITPDEIYPSWQPGDNPEEVLDALVNSSVVQGIKELYMGEEDCLYSNYGIGKTCYVPKTWIRIPVPDGHKLGGGARVREVAVYDNWGEMETGSGQTEVYYQQFTYETTNEMGQTFSSGVAAYEPMVGADENPLKLPVYSNNEYPMGAPDDRSYLEAPFGESFYPSPSVGYSKVKVENSVKENNLTRHKNGYTVYEFYTARDYPVISEKTDLQGIEHKSSLLGNLLKINVRNYYTASQGYAITINDMHGKPKAIWEYSENSENPVKGVEYFYKDNGSSDGEFKRIRGNRLDNNFKVLKQDGSWAQTLVGVDFDFMNDSREHYTNTGSMGAQLQIYGFVLFIIPIAVPAPWPVFNSSRTQFHSIVTTKVIQQYGILDQVINYDEGSRQSTKILALDHQTGKALLTRTSNEFRDPVFDFTYPAHFAYQGMDGSYRNIGSECVFNINSYNQVSHPSGGELLIPGNELGLINYDNEELIYAWVWKDENNYYLLKKDGTPLGSGTYYAKVYRSACRNMASTPIGSIRAMTDPCDWEDFSGITEAQKIIDASVSTYQGQWESYCLPQSMNPYITGNDGSWRLLSSWYYNTSRAQSSPQTSTRTDGTYVDFSPYWRPSQSYYWIFDDDNWIWQTRITKYSPSGNGLEELDRLNNYSAALYKYGDQLPVMTAKNARHRDIAYDGFEDYDFEYDFGGHLDFKTHINNLDNDNRHTGRYSLRVPANSSIEVECDVKQE